MMQGAGGGIGGMYVVARDSQPCLSCPVSPAWLDAALPYVYGVVVVCLIAGFLWCEVAHAINVDARTRNP